MTSCRMSSIIVDRWDRIDPFSEVRDGDLPKGSPTGVLVPFGVLEPIGVLDSLGELDTRLFSSMN